jgi:hypothetical protein
MNKAQLAGKFAEMCNLGLDKFPSSITLSLVRRAVAIFSAAAPGWFIEYVGPFFYDKRKEIAAENLDFFVKRSWQEQYESWGFLGSVLSGQWEDTIKTGVQHVHDTDPAALRSIPKSLVAMYCRYIIICQKDKAQ